MIISLVVAIAENGVIGRNGGLPWQLPSDLKTFRRVTMGKPVIMGRRTFQSLREPLAGRDNIVVSRDDGFRPEGAIVERDFASALARAKACAEARDVDEIMVIGGTDVFREALPLARFIYKTEAHAMSSPRRSCSWSARQGVPPPARLERRPAKANVRCAFALKGCPGL
jgi:dihydrofolate reductase